MQDNGGPDLTDALKAGTCLVIAIATFIGTGVLLLRSRVLFPSMVSPRAATSSLSSLLSAMVPSYRRLVLRLLQLLSQDPSSDAVAVLQFAISRADERNRSGDDVSSEARICIQGVTGEISRTFSSPLDHLHLITMQDNDNPELTAALTAGTCPVIAIATVLGTGILFLCSRVIFPFMVSPRAGKSSLSSLVSVMVPSYRRLVLRLLQLLSQDPSSDAVAVVQFAIGRANERNRFGDDVSSEARICIQGVTGETFSALVATALNVIVHLQRFRLELWATPLYNGVEQHLQGEVVAEQELASKEDNEEDIKNDNEQCFIRRPSDEE